MIKMTNETFDALRFWAEVGVSGIGALYFAIAEAWSLPYGVPVVATCAALSAFLGLFVDWQRKNHKIDVQETVQESEA